MSNEKMSSDEVLDVIRRVSIHLKTLSSIGDELAANALGDVSVAVAALIAERDALREDEKRLDWMQSDMTNGDDGVGIYWSDGGFVFPYLVSNAGGSGGGVGVAFFETLREAIDSARANEST